MSRRKRTHYTPEFKQQIIEWYRSGKTRRQLVIDYDLTPSALDRWIKQANTTGSFKERDNLTNEQKELIALRKQNQQLKMEVDILKQAALILGQK